MLSESIITTRAEWPTLKNNKSLTYFDSAASTQTHISVLDRMNQYYEQERCNANRGDYEICQKVSDGLERSRVQVSELLNCKAEQIIFTAGATHGLNMIAEWNKDVPVVFITEAEHTANILPWIVQGRTIENGRLQVLPLNDNGVLDIGKAVKLFESFPYSLLSIHSHSNVTGIPTNYKKLTKAAHDSGIKVCIDACQTIGTHEFDPFTVDYAVFSGHKMYGPTGVGVLYGRLPWGQHRALQQGGDTINHYDFSGNIDFKEGPTKHEPGTLNIAGILGLGVAAEYIKWVGYNEITRHMNKVDLALSDAGLFNIKGLKLIYPNYRQNGRYVYSFVCDGYHPSDLSAMVSLDGIAIRAGKLCAHPIVNKLSGGKGVLRVSPGMYTETEDINKLVEGLCKAVKRLT